MFVAYTSGSVEPLDWAAVKAQIHADDDTEQSFVETYIIPAVRQMAEAKTGTVLREATFTESWDAVAAGHLIPFAVSGVKSVESVTAKGVAVDASGYTLVTIGCASYIKFDSDQESLLLNYTAGLNMAAYPGVLAWMLLACAWAYAQREMMTVGQSIEEMPSSYLDSMLAPITVAPKF